MKYIKAMIMLPLAIIGLLVLAVVDLIRTIRGQQTVDEEWHNIYMEE